MQRDHLGVRIGHLVRVRRIPARRRGVGEPPPLRRQDDVLRVQLRREDVEERGGGGHRQRAEWHRRDDQAGVAVRDGVDGDQQRLQHVDDRPEAHQEQRRDFGRVPVVEDARVELAELSEDDVAVGRPLGARKRRDGADDGGGEVDGHRGVGERAEAEAEAERGGRAFAGRGVCSTGHLLQPRQHWRYVCSTGHFRDELTRR